MLIFLKVLIVAGGGGGGGGIKKCIALPDNLFRAGYEGGGGGGGGVLSLSITTLGDGRILSCL